jgi:surface antigen
MPTLMARGRLALTGRTTTALAILLLLLAGSVLANDRPARAAGNDYPYATGQANRVDPWGFYTRQCTSFVAWRMRQAGVPFTNNMSGGHWGNAYEWAGNARRLGYPVDTAPRVGAIAHWGAGEAGGGRWGHVAYVLAVRGDGSVVVEDYNFDTGSGPFQYHQRVTRAPRYLHVAHRTPQPPVVTSVPYSIVTQTANLRAGPGTNHRVLGVIGRGTVVHVSCQARGTVYDGSTMWNRLTDGRWVHDALTNSPNYNVLSPPHRWC